MSVATSQMGDTHRRGLFRFQSSLAQFHQLRSVQSVDTVASGYLIGFLILFDIFGPVIADVDAIPEDTAARAALLREIIHLKLGLSAVRLTLPTRTQST